MTAAGAGALRGEGAALPRPLDSLTASRNAWAEIDLGALEANVATLRSAVGAGVELIAVVKANAYGHGAAALAPRLEEMGADRLAVAWVSEALALRAAGARGPLLVLGHAFPADAMAAMESDITLTIHSMATARAVSDAAVAAGRMARVHVKVDTGLHRFGVTPEAAVALAEAARVLPGVEVEGLWTHIANADEEDDSFSDQQLEVFGRVVAQLPWIPYRHVANSASILRRPAMHFDGVRAGLALYGVAPGPHTHGRGLRPILQVKARLARVVDLAQGEGVSYGLAWKAERPSVAGLVPLGYGDGWRRSLAGGGEVLVSGQRCPIIGRVMMDHFMVDLTGLAARPSEGDEAVLLGSQGADCITADELAGRAGTISWDILASLQARIPRLYHRAGMVEAGD